MACSPPRRSARLQAKHPAHDASLDPRVDVWSGMLTPPPSPVQPPRRRTTSSLRLPASTARAGLTNANVRRQAAGLDWPACPFCPTKDWALHCQHGRGNPLRIDEAQPYQQCILPSVEQVTPMAPMAPVAMSGRGWGVGQADSPLDVQGALRARKRRFSSSGSDSNYCLSPDSGSDSFGPKRLRGGSGVPIVNARPKTARPKTTISAARPKTAKTV